MPESWLGSNRRILWVAMLPPMFVLLTGMLIASYFAGKNSMLVSMGGLLAIGSAGIVAVFCYLSRFPRLAYDNEHLLVYLRGTRPVRVPIEVVEVFFLGQGEAGLSGDEELETANVVVRLAEAATDWHKVEVKRSMGQWCDGYITIRGTWCEPLSLEKVNHLNHQLAEVRRSLRQPKESP